MEVQTALQELVAKYQRRHWEFAELDLSDINQPRSDGDALIHLVASYGGRDEIVLLVASGAGVNAAGDMGYTPLHNAAVKGRLDVINTLLGLGADPRIKSEFGSTPLDDAERYGHKQAAHLLRVASKDLRVRESGK